MNQKTVHNLIWTPIFLIGIISLAFGLIWIFHPEPWLIDQPANEALLQISFHEIFSYSANKFLPSYLTVIYKFFGLWLITIGLLFYPIKTTNWVQTSSGFNSLNFIDNPLSMYYLFSYLPHHR